MGHALWLGISLVWAAVSPAPKLELEEALQVDVTQAALTAPNLGGKTGLRTATQNYAPEEPSPPVPAAQPKIRVVKKPQYAIGDSWNLGGKRVLSVRLTPSPEECAPLVRLSF